MDSNNTNDRIIFGLRVKQQRQALKMSFAELSKASGLSISYLNEIEKGKKHPKPDKLKALASALKIKIEDLKSQDAHQSLFAVNELLRSNFLNELPLDFFGIEVGKIAEIITNAPTKVSAFISTLLEISKNYALNKEHFYFSALRSYLQLNYSYFPELEEAVKTIVKTYKVESEERILTNDLERILMDVYGYTINREALDTRPRLKALKSLYLPESKHLLLSNNLTSIQTSLQLGKELGFNFLGLKERANTSSILNAGSFTEVHNHSKAIYFSVALHMPLEEIIDKMKLFFNKKAWNAQAFAEIMAYYQATPEMFYHRLTNILPQFFAIKQLFFLRFRKDPSRGTFEIDRELHLDARHHPHGSAFLEHYCRRWGAISSLNRLEKLDDHEKPLIWAQRSKVWETEDEYLCLTIAWKHASRSHDVSVTIGMLINDNLKRTIQFWDDPQIPQVIVNKTCERCAISDCKERVVPPYILAQREQAQQLNDLIADLSEKFNT